MAGEDLSIKTRVEADVSNFEKGMNKAEKSLKGFSNKLADNINRLGKKGLVGSIANVTLAMGGLTQSFNTVIKFAKNVSKAINECTEAYKGQVIAERALDTAIANNPFISGASSKALKEFASEMQKVSNYGDEELIPMMTNLVSLGRTESETMQIMSVAMDMSAGMGISLDTAITQLNATLNGNIGRLGQQNAELKGLTEEELKQGKAIEILGEKFKGLSSATADTSKQLKNIKGDFKEALGQFTLPSSDMWNKFWSGFYEKGIEVLKKIDDWMDTSIIGEKMAENIEAQIKKLKGDKNKTGYAREAVAVISDRELELLIKYLEGQKKLNADEKIMLDVARERRKSIEYVNKAEKEYLEDLAEEKRKEEERLAKEKELAELRKKQAEEKEKALKIEGEWQDKLFAIRLENLEKTREKELENEELTYEQKIGIAEFYGEQILAMKLKQIEKEREEALKQDNLTEEARNAINLYYDNKTTQAKQEESDKRLAIKKKEIKEEEKEEEKHYSEMIKRAVEATKRVGENIAKVAKKIVSTIKDVVSSVVNIFEKIFKFDPDEALVNLLKIEDSILTFFMQTLPRLPSFMKSVMQSISVLVKNIRNILKSTDLKGILLDMLQTIQNSLPSIVSDVLDIFIDLVTDVMQALAQWLGTEKGLKTILNMILKIQQAVEKLVVDLIDDLADLLGETLDDIADFLAKSMTSANRTLPKLLKAVLKVVNVLIKAIAKAFENKEFADSIVASLKKTINVVGQMIPQLLESIIQLIFAIINAIIPRLPEIILYVMKAISNAMSNNSSDLGKALGEGIKKLFKSIFTKKFWIDSLQLLGEVLKDIFATAISGGLSSLGGGSGNSFVDGLLNLGTGGAYGLGHQFGWWAKGSNAVPSGLAIVGEAGPELVRFRGGEQVLNNRNTNKALAEMGKASNTFNVTFNNMQDTSAFAMMQQLKAYNRQMAINGII